MVTAGHNNVPHYLITQPNGYLVEDLIELLDPVAKGEVAGDDLPKLLLGDHAVPVQIIDVEDQSSLENMTTKTKLGKKQLKSSIYNNPQETSEKFNSFFASVGRKVYEEIRKNRQDREDIRPIQNENYRFYPRHERFRPSPVNVEKAVRIVNNLKNKLPWS